MAIKIGSINISEKKGTVKKPVTEVVIDEFGIQGDAHAGAWHRQISLLGRDSIHTFEEKAGRKIKSGEFAENIILEGIDLSAVSLLDRFRINEVLLEVTQIGKACHGDGCPIYIAVGDCVMPREGLFTRVLKSGSFKTGDPVTYIPKSFKITIITLSDRASRGEYQDLSGPKVKELLEIHFKKHRWHITFEQIIITDDAAKLKLELLKARGDGVDIVFTTGGTGIGPRDITPEVVTEMADRLLPGVMDHIRLKYGKNNPNALLSRSVAGVMETV